MRKRAEIIIKGRVQGVGYRFFAVDKAKGLNLAGYAQNKEGGDVFVVAEGEEEDIRAFLDWLKIGPQLSTVNKVITNWFDISNCFTDFTVKY
ncbi:hypothetical protein MNBD_BACTEROID01-82 [hydrothermal vent metagenome]|uniref:Acylphosphatase-like domain-containing protein n=1 Tax=hydrothermal vent metagenome TaxID=652676 RepID=A0A3B0U7E2_9ZZZZ